MSNMSYCRFENTLSDLNDCIDQIEMLLSGDKNTEPMSSPQERSARVWLIERCFDVVALLNDHGVEGDEIDLGKRIKQVIAESEASVGDAQDED